MQYCSTSMQLQQNSKLEKTECEVGWHQKRELNIYQDHHQAENVVSLSTLYLAKEFAKLLPSLKMRLKDTVPRETHRESISLKMFHLSQGRCVLYLKN
ncbi:Uncharacterized protein TCM_044756 [Theobroma cacao]|uniref:Uncharacterized protein n=1 Tax=Theobroma cacao TaxID=3641 RepID=A0A061FRV1_THECC|nr:Uncharacterized protein TCM_044756 [Theobroma cacao]